MDGGYAGRDGLSITECFGYRRLILPIILVIHDIQLNQCIVDPETVSVAV